MTREEISKIDSGLRIGLRFVEEAIRQAADQRNDSSVVLNEFRKNVILEAIRVLQESEK